MNAEPGRGWAIRCRSIIVIAIVWAMVAAIGPATHADAAAIAVDSSARSAQARADDCDGSTAVVLNRDPVSPENPVINQCTLAQQIATVVETSSLLRITDFRFAAQLAAIDSHLDDPYGDGDPSSNNARTDPLNKFQIRPADAVAFSEEYARQWNREELIQYPADDENSETYTRNEFETDVVVPARGDLSRSLSQISTDHYRNGQVRPVLAALMVEAVFANLAGTSPAPVDLGSWWNAEDDDRAITGKADEWSWRTVDTYLDHMRVYNPNMTEYRSWVEGRPWFGWGEFADGTYANLVEIVFDTIALFYVSGEYSPDRSFSTLTSEKAENLWNTRGSDLSRLFAPLTAETPEAIFADLQSSLTHAASGVSGTAEASVSNWLAEFPTSDRDGGFGPAGMLAMFALDGLLQNQTGDGANALLSGLVDDRSWGEGNFLIVSALLDLVKIPGDYGLVDVPGWFDGLTFFTDVVTLARFESEVSNAAKVDLALSAVGLVITGLAASGAISSTGLIFVALFALKKIIWLIDNWPAIAEQFAYRSEVTTRLLKVIEGFVVNDEREAFTLTSRNVTGIPIFSIYPGVPADHEVGRGIYQDAGFRMTINGHSYLMKNYTVAGGHAPDLYHFVENFVRRSSLDFEAFCSVSSGRVVAAANGSAPAEECLTHEYDPGAVLTTLFGRANKLEAAVQPVLDAANEPFHDRFARRVKLLQALEEMAYGDRYFQAIPLREPPVDFMNPGLNCEPGYRGTELLPPCTWISGSMNIMEIGWESVVRAFFALRTGGAPSNNVTAHRTDVIATEATRAFLEWMSTVEIRKIASKVDGHDDYPAGSFDKAKSLSAEPLPLLPPPLPPISGGPNLQSAALMPTSDGAVSFNEATGKWQVLGRDGLVERAGTGRVGDVPLRGDVDGDGVDDFVIWRPSTGLWHGVNSRHDELLNQYWGRAGDVPLLGDVDGDGFDDMIVWRPSNGHWYVKSTNTFAVLKNANWGTGRLGDIPLVGDLDGDGRDDMIIWRPGTASANGRFYVKNLGWSTIMNRSWGAGRLDDIPLVGDVDGDGADEVVIFRSSTGVWYPLSIDGSRPVNSISLGGDGVGVNWPLMFDVDGDGDDDVVVRRVYGDKQYWYARDSAGHKIDALYGTHFGTSAEIPVANNQNSLLLSTSPWCDNKAVTARVALSQPATAGDDVILGTEGNDTVKANFGDDVICALGGDDVISGNQGDDRIFGGAGNDNLHGGYDDDVVYGEAGNDRISNNRGVDTMRGGPGNDHITGGIHNDTIYGDDGDDALGGGTGNDRIWGGNGDDRLWGNDGDDFLAGNINNDRLWGGNGNDELHGGYNDDVVFGEAGDDKLVNNRGNDTMNGGAGTDTCTRGNGTDTLVSC